MYAADTPTDRRWNDGFYLLHFQTVREREREAALSAGRWIPVRRVPTAMYRGGGQSTGSAGRSPSNSIHRYAIYTAVPPTDRPTNSVSRVSLSISAVGAVRCEAPFVTIAARHYRDVVFYRVTSIPGRGYLLTLSRNSTLRRRQTESLNLLMRFKLQLRDVR